MVIGGYIKAHIFTLSGNEQIQPNAGTVKVEKQMEDYELKPAPGNPDQVRPSITARLKDGAGEPEYPKEPSQKHSHKNHEER